MKPRKKNCGRKNSNERKPASAITLALIYGVSGIVLFYYFFPPIFKTLQAFGWNALPCEIGKSYVWKHKGTRGRHGFRSDSFHVAISFSYTVAGRRYAGDRYDFTNGSFSSDEVAKTLVDRYPTGKQTVCYVNPLNPADAVIDRGFTRTMGQCGILLLFLAFGAWNSYSPRFAKRTIAVQRTGGGLPSPADSSGVPQEPDSREAGKLSRKRSLRQDLVGIVWAAIGIPLLSLAKYGELHPLFLWLTIFIVVILLIVAFAPFIEPPAARPEVSSLGVWTDWVGAVWLPSCAFGPLLGWIVTSFPMTPSSWHWLYGSRVFLAAGLPIATALVCARYARYQRGREAWVLILLLVGITLLPVGSVFNVSRDLWCGPIVRQVPATGGTEYFLQYTERHLIR